MSEISDYSQFATPRAIQQRKTEEIFWVKSPTQDNNTDVQPVRNKSNISTINECM